MNVFLVLVLVAAVVMVGLLALAVAGRTGFAAPLSEPVRALPPVLLPPVPEAGDVDALRFSPGLRGYRMDQVDEVLETLSGALAERDAEIARLRQRAGRIPGESADDVV
ncbi:DivIVA domain-containing protein [Citricoccus alkalitolerans]|uniref:DivIVA domain-containing protein n=1 Tax=Citricoccus alkalitolerans TaxID=246603 RepID=A0ABV8XRK3_9MICC